MNIPILMYHEIVGVDENMAHRVRTMAASYYTKVDVFEKQLAVLRDNGFQTILLDNLARRLAQRSRWCFKEKCAVLSFDDGYEGNYTRAFPLLKKFGFTATFFVAADWIGQPGMMTWPMLMEMSRCGMSIQSHTKTHPFLKQLSDEQVLEELTASKRIIEQHVHSKVRFVSLPHGSYGENFKRLAIAAGYAGGCSSHIGYNTVATDGYFMPRIHISSHYNVDEFKKIVLHKGIFEPLLEFKQMLRGLARAIMGENLYMGIYRVIFGIR
jgi:peptidoglycan/xylan/chitin deacetylase (PgdA/CDA1 family)